MMLWCIYSCFFFNDTATTEIYTYLHTLSLHDALPIYRAVPGPEGGPPRAGRAVDAAAAGAACHRRVGQGVHQLRPGLRSEEHTSELQSLMRSSYAVFCL